jgi:hypothetical protein
LVVLILHIYTKNFTVYWSKTRRDLKRNPLLWEMFSGFKNAEKNPLSSYPSQTKRNLTLERKRGARC